jgi:urocanate hydratase
MLDLQRAGAVTFDYGNNIRRFAADRGRRRRVPHPRLRPRVHPAAVLRRTRPVPLGGAFGRAVGYRRHRPAHLPLFPSSPTLTRWISLAQQKVHFQGLPARICWLGYGERARIRAGDEPHGGHAASCRRPS